MRGKCGERGGAEGEGGGARGVGARERERNDGYAGFVNTSFWRHQTGISYTQG